MIHMRTKVQCWGNSLAIRLTGAARTVPHFAENMFVDLEISEEGIHIRPEKKALKRLPLTEAQLLEGMTPALAHADELICPIQQEWSQE